MKILIVLILSFTFVWASELDSIVTRSIQSRDNSRVIKGFVISRGDGGGKVITPVLKAVESKSVEEKSFDIAEKSFNQFRQLRASRYDSLNIRIASLENKVAIVLNNMQDQADSNTRHLDFVLKLLEIFGAFFGGLASLLAVILPIMLKHKRREN